ncbi:MAG: capsule assembly Wzi family protein, partial [Planctomycetota bacterium]
FVDVITTAEDDNENQPGNQLAAIDWRLTIPWKPQPFEFYGEFGGEDEAGGIFSRFAIVAGLYLPRLGPWALLDLRVEYADTYFDSHGNRPMFWYTHGVYQSGYTYEGRVIGHHAGTDARDIYVELGVYPAPGLRVWAAYDYEERVVSLDEPEIRTECGLGVEWTPHERLVLEAAFVHEGVEDALVPEDPAEGNRFKLAATWKF